MMRFYICNICGNIVEMIEDSSVTPTCCGDDMEELLPGTTDGAKEKHIPVFRSENTTLVSEEGSVPVRIITVNIGELPHPMEKQHSITWVMVETDTGVYRKTLDLNKGAQIDFVLKEEEKIKVIYAYCNLHRLWACYPNE